MQCGVKSKSFGGIFVPNGSLYVEGGHTSLGSNPGITPRDHGIPECCSVGMCYGVRAKGTWRNVWETLERGLRGSRT